jgi:hypothetical protein
MFEPMARVYTPLIRMPSGAEIADDFYPVDDRAFHAYSFLLFLEGEQIIREPFVCATRPDDLLRAACLEYLSRCGFTTGFLGP